MLKYYQLVFFITEVSRMPFKSKVKERKMNINEKRIAGNAYSQVNDTKNALKEYQEGVDYITSQLSINFYNLDSESKKVDHNSMKEELAYLYYNMSLIHFKHQDYPEAINKLNASLSNFELYQAKSKMAVCLYKTGEVFKAMEMTAGISNKSKELRNMANSIHCNIFTNRYGSKYAKNIDHEYCRNVFRAFLKNQRIDKEQLVSILGLGYILHLNIDNVQFVCAEDAIVFGDTHGQFLDTCNILNELKCKFDNDNFSLDGKTYIFNGDFVDRGCDGIENFVFLLLLKVLYPKQIYLNRGNHEFESVNRQFGFFEEIKLKYNTYEQEISYAFQLVFSALPLCTILNKKYFIVHGGLPEIIVSIKEIQNINRFHTNIDGCLMEGLMWSDPGEIASMAFSRRGAGIVFGYEITNGFLKYNNIEKIVRSHEYVSGGIKYNHDKRVITIFSAPNYCNMEGDAAVLSIKGDEISVVEIKHWEQYEEYANMIKDCRS